MKNLLEKFNNEKNIIVITLYPPKKTTYNGNGGLYSFGKNFVKNLANKLKNKIIVVAQKNNGNDESYSENKKIIIIKVIKKDSLFSFLKILAVYIPKLNYVKKFIIQFEFNSFGGVKATFGILILIARAAL
ncbi:MAG: hypothetical protein ACK4FL_03885 [Microgenomates group bacterium]